MKKTNGFTRIDILAVILIIVLLLAVSLPALNLPREMARRAFCAAQLKNLGIANEMYADNNDGWFVPAGYPYIIDQYGNQEVRHWVNNQAFRSYLQMDSYRTTQTEYSSGFDALDEFLCPSDTLNKDPKNASAGVLSQSYGYNITDWGGIGNWSPMWQRYVGHNRNQIENPSEKLMITEGIQEWWLSWKGADYKIIWDNFGMSLPRKGEVSGGIPHGTVAYRHSEGINILFYDAHVGYMPKEQAYIHDDWNADPKRPGMWSIYDELPYKL